MISGKAYNAKDSAPMECYLFYISKEEKWLV